MTYHKYQLIIAMMPLMFRKCTGGDKLCKSQEKINLIIFMDNMKLTVKNENKN